MIFKRKRELLLCGSYLQLEAFFMTSTQGRVTFQIWVINPLIFVGRGAAERQKSSVDCWASEAFRKYLQKGIFVLFLDLLHQIFQVRGSTIVFCSIQIPVPFRYPIKVMSAGTDDKLLSQKMYFGDGGVYTAIIQPDPKKNDQVEFLFTE